MGEAEIPPYPVLNVESDRVYDKPLHGFLVKMVSQRPCGLETLDQA